MKSKLLVISIFLLSQSLLAETYVCPHELSRYGRSGEIEMYTYIRDGGSFQREMETSFFKDNSKLEIQYESDEYLILTKVQDLAGASLNVEFINKKTKEFGASFITMDNFRSEQPYNVTYGKCKFLN